MTCFLRPISLLLFGFLFFGCGATHAEHPSKALPTLPVSPHRVGESSRPKRRGEDGNRGIEKGFLTLLRKRTLTHGVIECFAVEPTTNSLFIASGGVLKRFRLSENLPYSSERRIGIGNARVTAIAFDDARIFLGLSDESLLVVDRETCRTRFKVIGFFWRIYSILPLNERTVLVSDSAAVREVSLKDRKIVTSYKSRNYDIYALLPLGNGRFVTAGGSGRLEVWSSDNGEDSPIKSVREHGGEVVHLETDGESVFSFCRDGSVGVWDADMNRLAFLLAHSAPIRSGTLSRNGRLVIVLHEDSHITLFSAERRELLLSQKLEVTSPVSVVATGDDSFAVLTRKSAFLYRIVLPSSP